MGRAICLADAVATGAQAQTGVKEYIRVGGRVVAIDTAALSITTTTLPTGPVGTAHIGGLIAASGGTRP